MAGNPNVGKSVIFHRLSGVYAEVSNYPGTTIDLLQAQLRMGGKLLTLTDTPGVYGVGSGNEEERVARDVLLASDVVIDVVDASHLARDLFLTLQLIDMGKPLIVVLNLMDEAEASGYSVDIEELSRRLGVPVIPAVAVEGKGIEEIKAALSGHGATFRRGEVDPVVAARLNGLPQAESLLILEGDEEIAGRHRLPPGDAQEVFFLSRRRRANEIAAAVLTQKQVGRRFQQWLGEAALRPVSGVFILAVVLYGLYLVVGVGVAQNLVGFTEVRLGQEGWEPWIRGNFARYAAATISVGETSFVFPAGTARDPEQYAALAEEIAAHPDLVPTYRFESPIVKVLVG
ncbi:MAG: GTP-binding protein, partial [Deltaproteobacteria bacterium]